MYFTLQTLVTIDVHKDEQVQDKHQNTKSIKLLRIGINTVIQK